MANKPLNPFIKNPEYNTIPSDKEIDKALGSFNEEPTEQEKLQAAAAEARVEMFHDEIERGGNVMTLGAIKESQKKYEALRAQKEKEILNKLPGTERVIGGKS